MHYIFAFEEEVFLSFFFKWILWGGKGEEAGLVLGKSANRQIQLCESRKKARLES